MGASVSLSYPVVALYLGLGWPRVCRCVLDGFLEGGAMELLG